MDDFTIMEISILIVCGFCYQENLKILEPLRRKELAAAEKAAEAMKAYDPSDAQFMQRIDSLENEYRSHRQRRKITELRMWGSFATILMIVSGILLKIIAAAIL